jgi:hypothetical protein
VCDGIDEMAQTQSSDDPVGFLPKTFPGGVRCILTTGPGNTLTSLAQRGCGAITIWPMDEKQVCLQDFLFMVLLYLFVVLFPQRLMSSLLSDLIALGVCQQRYKIRKMPRTCSAHSYVRSCMLTDVRDMYGPTACLGSHACF